jgi:hypothetical protein
MSWAWNNDYKDLGQVEPFYPAYLTVYEQLRAAGGYPFNADFKGRIPGIEGPREDTAIYLLQKLRSIRDMEAKVTGHRAAGWRDVDLAELDGGPVRFAGVAEYGWHPLARRFAVSNHSAITLRVAKRFEQANLSANLAARDEGNPGRSRQGRTLALASGQAPHVCGHPHSQQRALGRQRRCRSGLSARYRILDCVVSRTCALIWPNSGYRHA